MFRLSRVERPEFEIPTSPVRITDEIADARIAQLRERAGTDWIVVWGDREHFANVHHLTGYDPRFEEALLVLGPQGRSALLVGNEGELYAEVVVGATEVVLCQTFSLMGQRRERSGRLDEILRDLGMGAAEQIGIVGWKYSNPDELIGPDDFWIPSYLVSALRAVAPAAELSDVTRVMIDPVDGLRAANEAINVALLEFGAARASEAVQRIIRASQPGVTELEAVGQMGFAGEPLSAHVIYSAGSTGLTALRSPTGRVLERGDALSTAVGYWGGLTCRAGLIDTTNDEFVSRWAEPFFRSVATWYSRVGEGAVMGEVFAEVTEILAAAGLESSLNPGHMTGTDEWVHAGFFEGSELRVASGMALQCDIIPTGNPPEVVMNSEDGLVIAGESLRGELATQFPEVWARIQARRTFMTDQLGIELHDSLLPLSNTPAYYAPLMLAPDNVFVRA